MDIFETIIIGIVAGFTEFLPISSTGHMIIVSEFMGIPQNAVISAYQVIIQFATILAVIMIYREKMTVNKIMLWRNIFIAFLPFAVVGYIFEDVIKSLFSLHTVAWMFIIGGIIFLIVEYFYKEKSSHVTDVEEVSLKQSFYIGLAQIFSLVPGTSRAGATIIGGLLVGLDRKSSTEFSFLLAIPVMSLVFFYELFTHYKAFSDANLIAFFIGFITAFIVAYMTIKLFLVFIQRFTFVIFGIYRIVFGVILLLL